MNPIAVNVRDKISKLNAIQRKKVEKGAAELAAEELSLRNLRRLRKLLQARVTKPLFPRTGMKR